MSTAKRIKKRLLNKLVIIRGEPRNRIWLVTKTINDVPLTIKVFLRPHNFKGSCKFKKWFYVDLVHCGLFYQNV